MKATLLHDQSKNDIYPLTSTNSASSSSACLGVCTSFNNWHQRLDHPSAHIFRQVISQYNLSVDNSQNQSICNVCQMGKSHVLPFPNPHSVFAFHQNLCLLMFGDLPPLHLPIIISTMFHLLMILANLFDFFPYKINQMFYRYFLLLKLMLNIYLIIK